MGYIVYWSHAKIFRQTLQRITGMQAIQMQIETFDFTQYLSSLFPWYTVMFSVILSGCLLHIYWLLSNKSDSA